MTPGARSERRWRPRGQEGGVNPTLLGHSMVSAETLDGSLCRLELDKKAVEVLSLKRYLITRPKQPYLEGTWHESGGQGNARRSQHAGEGAPAQVLAELQAFSRRLKGGTTMSNDRWQGEPWWPGRGIDADRRRALAGLSAIVLAAMGSRPDRRNRPPQARKHAC